MRILFVVVVVVVVVFFLFVCFLKIAFGCSADKNNPNFIQPLIAFRYSNICYCSCMCNLIN